MADWTIKVPPLEKVIIPSFIRLFVMSRILNHCNMTVDQIKQMVTSIKDIDLKQQQTAQDILTRLINDGIKKYMEKWFNEQEQMQMIEIIFNKIVLKQFKKEYQRLMTYNYNDRFKKKSAEYYQTLVFNTDDLMSLIFQFIELKETFSGDLINCSLVNSHWLYQSWNPNSIYKLCLNILIHNTIKMTGNMTAKSASNKSVKSNDQVILSDKDLDRILSSKWQRVSNVKSANIELYESYKFSKFHLQLQYLLEKASLLRSIVTIRLDVHNTYFNIALLKSLLHNNKKGIERYYVDIDGIDTWMSNKLKPLELIMAQNISVVTMYYYIVWSRRCKILNLHVQGIDENWMRWVIDNCDCSGVEKLTLDDISFSSLLNPETRSTQLLFNRFAQKFNKLQSLNVILAKVKKNICLILLLRYLSPIIKQNSTMVALDVDSSFIDCDKLGEMIQDTGLKIYQLSIWITKEESIEIDCLKPIVLNNAKLEYLQMVNFTYYQDVVETRILDLLLTLENETSSSKFNCKESSLNDHDDELTQQEDKSPLSSLKMIYIEDADRFTSIDTIDQILKLKLIKKHKLYIKTVFDIHGTHSQVFQKSFKTLCQTAASLLMSQQNPIELDITINDLDISHFEKTYYPIFEQYLNQDVANNCKVPIVNKYCNLLPEPVISLTFEQKNHDDDGFYFDNSDSKMRFQVCNVTKKL